MLMWTGGHIPVRVVNVTWTDLSALACMHHLWSQVWSALGWFWSYWKAMAGSLSVARIAVISKGCCSCCWGGWKVRGVYEVKERPENTVLWNTGMDWGCWAEPNLTKKCLFSRKDWRRISN
jgi:hypothetical protein